MNLNQCPEPPTIPVGDGLPYWLDTDVYLSAPEVRALGERMAHSSKWPRCAVPSCPDMATDHMHIARKQMGGRNESGPTVAGCRKCHACIDNRGDRTLAVTRQGHRVCLVYRDGTTLDLGWL